MLSQSEIKELYGKVDIGALLTFVGAPIKNLKPHKKMNGIPYDYRINAFWRGGDNPSGAAFTFDFTKQKWIVSDFTQRSVTNVDLIDFLMKCLGYKFRQAVDLLVFASGKENGFEQVEQQKKEAIKTHVVDRAFLEACNTGKLHPYWQSRGFTPEIAKHFLLGYCSFNGVLKDRLTIPIFNEHGKLVAVQGRSTNDDIMPKYIYGSSEQGEAAKRTLYNFQHAKVHAMSRGWIGVVESANSVWRAVTYDYGNFVATMSNSVTVEQEELLVSTGKNIVIFSDNDASMAGQQSSVNLAQRLVNRNVNTWLAIPPVIGQDPEKLNKDTFTLCLKNARKFGN